MNEQNEVVRLLCSWCGSDSELYRTKFLVIDQIICKECLRKQDAELGIEEWDE